MRVHAIDLSTEINEDFFTQLAHLAGASRVTQKRLTEICIELFQNIRRHAATRMHAKLVVIHHASGFSLESVNHIHAGDIQPLSEAIAHINRMNAEELKHQHRRKLMCAQPTASPGLGLYRIAMRSASPLTARFTPSSTSNHYLFTLQLNLTTR